MSLLAHCSMLSTKCWHLNHDPSAAISAQGKAFALGGKIFPLIALPEGVIRDYLAQNGIPSK